MPKNNARKWLESLETRQMMSASYPTALEQYVIELVNRARANPAAEAVRYGIDLNEGLKAGTIAIGAKQPLAVNPYLTDSARKHSQWMIDQDAFSHTGAKGSDPGDRMKAAGFRFDAPWSWAENIALRSFKTGAPHPDVFDAIEKDLFVDIGIADRGHRLNLLAAQNSEIGIGSVAGQYSYFNAAMLTQDFASSGGNTFATGVIYTDAVKKDRFYTPGEGLGGVTVTATRISDGATFTTQSWASGGYALKLSPGAYKVTAAGGSLGRVITYDSVTIARENVKRDFTPASSPNPTPPPTKPPVPIPPPPTKPPLPNPPPPKTPPPSNLPPTNPPPKTPPPPQAPPDQSAPSAKAHALRKRTVSRYYRFTVTYTDDTAVQASSIGNGDIQVRSRGNYARTAILVGVDNSANGKTRTVTYQVKGPRGRFNRAHNGLYTIWAVNHQVQDTSGNFLPARQIGAFIVRVSRGASTMPLPRPPALLAKKQTRAVSADETLVF